MNRSLTKLILKTGLVVAGVITALGLSGCAPLLTQNPGQGWSPANVKDSAGAPRLLLDGHDVVAYFTESKHVKGSAEHAAVYKGVTLYFASAANKTQFNAAPEKFLPQYGGFCANGIVYGIPWGGDADSWLVVDNRLFIFGGSGSKKAFMLDIPANIALADRYWKEEVKDSNAFFQRSKRMVLRVPHYKSGGDLAQMVAEKEKTAK
jgi:YHS domain-containing protein